MPRDRTLIEIFSAEQSEHVGRLRALADALAGGGSDRLTILDEALRRAHTLKGAARAVGLERTEVLAHRLETVFARARDGVLVFDLPAASVVHRVLDAMEDILASMIGDGAEPDTSAAGNALGSLLGDTPSGVRLPGNAPTDAASATDPAPRTPASGDALRPETIRVSAASIDELIRTSSQLFAAIAVQSEAETRIEEQAAHSAEILRQWHLLRRQCNPYVRSRQDDPDFAPVLECLNYIDGRLRSLGAGTRAAASAQRRRHWDLRRRSEGLKRGAAGVRMTPAETVFGSFGAMARDLARQENKQIEFRAEGLETQADRAVLQGLKDSVMHLLRNAVSHGIGTPAERRTAGKDPTGILRLSVDSLGDRLNITVEDDGRGIDAEAVSRVAAAQGVPTQHSPEQLLDLIFRPGFSTSTRVTNLAGRGMGLSVVQQAVSRMQGEIQVIPRKSGGTAFVISVPLSISTLHVLMLAAGGFTFGLPARFVEELRRTRISELQTVEGREVLATGSGPVRLARLAALLGLSEIAGLAHNDSQDGGSLQIAIVAIGGHRAGIVVDRFLDDREVVVKDLGLPDRMAGMTAGGVALEDGTVAPILDPAAVLEKFRDSAPVLKLPAEPERKSRRILVVDDSITTRSLEKSILEAHGYDVRVAVDGVEALERLRAEPADLVITDIMMPRMDGLQLLQEIKNDGGLTHIPVIVVTSLERREDQERGLSLGADAYIVKRKFDQRELLNTVRQIL